MPLSIRTNMASLSAVSSLTKTQSSLSKSIGRISTGLKHAGFADGASEMAFGQKLESDKTSLKAAMSNTSQGISLLSVGEDALNQVYSALTKMREIAVSSSNGAASSSDRATYASEFNALRTEVSRILNTTTFNGISVLHAAASSSLVLQVGVDAANILTLTRSTFSTSLAAGGLSIAGSGAGHVSVNNASAALAAITGLDTALGTVNNKRAGLGVAQTKLENVLSYAQAQHEAYSTAISSILDVDYAEETANMTRFQIMQQAGVAALGQARSIPQSILSLLG
jgi:flagellin